MAGSNTLCSLCLRPGRGVLQVFLLVLALGCLHLSNVIAFLPGETPTLYREGQVVEIQVGHVESQADSISIPFYDAIPICKPRKLRVLAQTASDIFNPRWQQASLFRMHMKEDQKCKILCQRTYTTAQLRTLAAMIEGGYRANFLVDSMPALMEEHDPSLQGEPPGAAGHAQGPAQDGARHLGAATGVRMNYGIPLGYRISSGPNGETSTQIWSRTQAPSRRLLAVGEGRSSGPSWSDLAARAAIPAFNDLQALRAQRERGKMARTEREVQPERTESNESSFYDSLLTRFSITEYLPGWLGKLSEMVSNKTSGAEPQPQASQTTPSGSQSWFELFSRRLESDTASTLAGNALWNDPAVVAAVAAEADALLSISPRTSHLLRTPLPPNTKYYLNNHIRFIVHYSEESLTPGGPINRYGIVSVEAYPVTIAHNVLEPAKPYDNSQSEDASADAEEAQDVFTGEDSPEHQDPVEEDSEYGETISSSSETASPDGLTPLTNPKTPTTQDASYTSGSKNTYSPVSRSKKRPPVLEACQPPGPLSNSPAPISESHSITPMLIWDTAYEDQLMQSLGRADAFIQHSTAKSAIPWSSSPSSSTTLPATPLKLDSTNEDLPPFARLDGLHEIVWTYEVRFQPSPLRATARWGLYGALDLPANVHWTRFYLSLSLVLSLTIIVGVLFRRAYYRDVLWKLRYGDNSAVQRALARASAEVTAAALRKHRNLQHHRISEEEYDTEDESPNITSSTKSGAQLLKEADPKLQISQQTNELVPDLDPFKTVERALEVEAEADVDRDGVFNQLFAEIYTMQNKENRAGSSTTPLSKGSPQRPVTTYSPVATKADSRREQVVVNLTMPTSREDSPSGLSGNESDTDNGSPVNLHSGSLLRPFVSSGRSEQRQPHSLQGLSRFGACGRMILVLISCLINIILLTLTLISQVLKLMSRPFGSRSLLFRCSTSLDLLARRWKLQFIYSNESTRAGLMEASSDIELISSHNEPEGHRPEVLDDADVNELVQAAIASNENELVDGWRNVAGDVFRAPPHPDLLAIATGSGVQLLALVATTLLAAVAGLAVPSSRPKVLTAVMVLFVLSSTLGGYVTTQLAIFFDTPRPKNEKMLKQMKHEEQLLASGEIPTAGTRMLPVLQYSPRYAKLAAATSVGFPTFVMFLLGALYALVSMTGANRSDKVLILPPTLVHLAVLWLLVALPLGQLGCYQALKRPLYRVPPRPVHTIPRRIPRLVTTKEERELVIERIKQRKAERRAGNRPTQGNIMAELPVRRWKWYRDHRVTWLLGALLTFAPCVVELRYIMHCALLHQYYSAFGFALVLCAVLILTAAEASAMTSYLHLSAEDYRWWWRSFKTCGSSAGFLFFVAVIHFIKFRGTATFVAGVLYFAFISILGMSFFFMTGAIGFIASFLLVHAAYSRIDT